MKIFSISGPSATIYAYLGEFHSNNQRGRAIMGSTIILGTACILMPLAAWIVINQEWEFYVPIIDIIYKPWRMYVVVSGLPGFLGALVMIFLPESPKFKLAQGNRAAAHEILKKMNRWNNGRKSSLESFDLYEESESIENRQRTLDCKNSRFPLLQSIWNQTAPLFKPPYLRATLLICIIQFGMYATANGFFMFYAEILNRMAANFESGTRMMMCDVINMKTTNINASTIQPNQISEVVSTKNNRFCYIQRFNID